MQTEWLALWAWFILSGGLTMLFCVFTWWKMGIILAPAKDGACMI
jgi:hypothetical protein